MIDIIKKIIKHLKIEFVSLFENFITYYPDTKIGKSLRGFYFGNKFKKKGKNLNLMHGFRVSHPEKIVVGDRFSCNIFTYLNCGNCNGIYFGDNVALGPNVYIRSANHVYNKDNTDVRDLGYQETKIAYKDNFYSIIIEGNNWIGANCTILPGTFIEKGAIVGAGCVISGKIKANSVYVTSRPKFAFNREN